MTRYNEKDSKKAGARFSKMVISDLKIGCPLMIFTSDYWKAKEYLKEVNLSETRNFRITIDSIKALDYLKFK